MKAQQQCRSHLDDSFLIQRRKDQILSISITGERGDFNRSSMTRRGNLFTSIVKIFTDLRCLKFYSHVPDICSYVFFADPPTIFSSTLVELHINTYLFDYCLHLLDGRLDRLRTFVVDTAHICSLEWTQINTVSQNNKRSSSSIDRRVVASRID